MNEWRAGAEHACKEKHMVPACEYVFSNAWELAELRLLSLERGHDPATIRRLNGLGVTEGWDCLELGAGLGSIARWLCGGGRSFVTAHLSARDEGLSRFTSMMRPGGIVLIEEDHVFPISATAEGAYGAAWSVFIRAMEDAGVAPTWFRTLPARCLNLGSIDVTTDVDVPLFTAGSPEADFWRLTWLQAVDRIVAAGAPRELIDVGIGALSEPGAW